MRIGICGPVSTAALQSYLHVPMGAPKGLGGTPVNQLAIELLRRGRQVTVVSCDPHVNPGDEVILEGHNLRVCYGPYRPQHRAWDGFRIERRFLAEALRRESPDLVHAHWTYEFALGALSSGRPTLITCHDWAPTILRYTPDAYRSMRLGMQVVSLTRGKQFTAVSPYIQHRIAPLTRGPVTVVPNGLEDSLFQDGQREPPDLPIIVSVNNGFSRLKNVATLLAAFNLVRKKHTNARLILVGQGYEEGGPAHSWARGHGLGGNVVFHGWLHNDAVDQLLSCATMLVHPSREESFCCVLVEAMAKGVPVIAGQQSGAVPWVLDEGRAGMLVDITAQEELSSAMESLLESPAEWERYAAAGREHAWRSFRMQRVADLYEDEYARLLARRS